MQKETDKTQTQLTLIFPQHTLVLDPIHACNISSYLNEEYRANCTIININKPEFTPFVVEKLEELFKNTKDPLPLLSITESVFSQPCEEIFNFILATDFLEIDSLFQCCVDSFSKTFDEFNSPDKIRRVFRIDHTGFDREDEIQVMGEIRNVWGGEVVDNGDDSSFLVDRHFTDPSVSMIVEEKMAPVRKGHLFNHLKSRIRFVSSNEQEIKCLNCNTLFTNLWRAHHCRICSHLFCGNCVSNVDIPETYRAYVPVEGLWGVAKSLYRYGKEPVCKGCVGEVSSQVPLVATAFAAMGLTLHVLKKAATICGTWRHAAIQCLGILRKIQYHFPTHHLEKFEKRLLWNNRRSWVAHHMWLVQFLKAVDWNNPEQSNEALSLLNHTTPRLSCWETMCTSRCRKSNVADPEQALTLLNEFTTDLRVRQYAVNCLRHITSTELECYVPLLVHNLRYEPVTSSPTFDLLLNAALVRDNVQLRSEFYWSLTLSAADPEHRRRYDLAKGLLVTGITEKLGIGEVSRILSGLELVSVFDDLRNSPEISRKKLSSMKNMYIPLDDGVMIQKIHTESIEVKDSATEPLVIPCSVEKRKNPKNFPVEKGTQESVFLYKLMFKFEDIRKDQIVMNLLKCSNLILEKAGLSYRLLTYHVLPTGVESGILQIVQHAATFNTVSKEYQDLWHFFRIENFDGQITDREMYRTFFQSAAAYSVVSFLLNVGDRHLDNIMVTSRGEFFHVDYGFILGEEPSAFKKALGTRSPVKITQKMKDTIQTGNMDGQTAFKEFLDECSKIYLILRRHYVLFMNMLMLLHVSRPKIDYQYSLEYVEEELRERFLPGTSDKDAKDIFENVLKNEETIMNYFTDIGHHVKKQQALGKMTLAASNTIRSVFDVVWGVRESIPTGSNRSC